MIDKKLFFDNYPFGELKPEQKRGLEFLLMKLDGTNFSDNETAYILATVKHETADTFQPIQEWEMSRKGKLYNTPHPVTGKTYFGRGFVQLTWYDNYKKFALLTGEPLVYYPEKAQDPETAWKILEIGMTGGEFTGYKLSDFFTESKCDFFTARKIINGLDRADVIAAYARLFLDCLI